MKKIINRPTFYLNDNAENPVRAGGVLFYRYDDYNNDYHLLLINSRNKYEDFGGCSDNVDSDIEQMVCREVEEESNMIFGQQYILDNIKGMDPVYIKYCKYVLYFIPVYDTYDPEIFGQTEICDDIERTVEWVPYTNFKDSDFIKKLSFRLGCKQVLSHLQNLFI